jgi:hypothetical protein
VFVFRAVSVGVGCRVPVAPSGPVWPSQDVEQVFDLPIRTSVSNKCSKVVFGSVWENFQPNPDRILTESRTESQPNLDRISEFLSLTVQPNPNRILKSVKDFILLAACFLGVRCRIYEQGLMGC